MFRFGLLIFPVTLCFTALPFLAPEWLFLRPATAFFCATI